MNKFSIEEIRNYILSQNSLGDILYNLSSENIEKAQPKLLYTTENTFAYFVIYDNDQELRFEKYVNIMDLDEDEISELLENVFLDDFEANDIDTFNIKCEDGTFTINRHDEKYSYEFSHL